MTVGNFPESRAQLSPARHQASYVLGHSEIEIRRLLRQAEMLRPITERLLKLSGLKEGMQVLDMGCGAGDLTMLAARIVGPAGSVVGVDQNSEAISLARRRAAEANLANVSFEVAALPALEGPRVFDAAIGRYLLVHQPTPAAFLRAIARFIRPGGLMVCHEVYPRFALCSSPNVAPWEQIGALLRSAAVRLPGVGACEDMHQTFEKAGFRVGEVYYEIPVAQDAQSPLIDWVASSARAFLPLAEAEGTVNLAAFDPVTLEQTSRDAIRNAGSHVTAWLQVCAWATR